MQAVIVEHRGEAGTLRDVPIPQPGTGELLVRITAASVNPIDWKLRDRGDRPLPFVLGQDFAGVVSRVGEGVSDYAEGERIFGIAREHGAYAQFTIVPAHSNDEPVAHIPDDVGDADAASLPTAGLTALAALDAMNVGEGTNLVILGVTGGVGSFAAQMAKARGARVIGTGSSKHEANARDLGVSDYVAYDTGDDNLHIRSLLADGADAVLDLVDGADTIERRIEIMRPGAAIVSTIGALDVASLSARGYNANNLVMNATSQSSRDGLRALAKMVEDGTILVRIEAERDLRDAPQLLEQSRSGSVSGKLVLTVETGRI